jgi:small-conductance mechanosensitive channel/CRP-like cAMP-binding protein
MSASLIPAAILLVIAIVSIYGLRRCSERVRLGFDAVCFLAVSAYFLGHHTFPVFPPLGGSPDSAALEMRAIGGAWWLLGSRLVVMGLWMVHRRDRSPHETRLFFDISAAAIYLATAIVVLNSVFALPVAGIVATSGVVAIVIGLALQNTLADVFAGIAVGVETPFRVGDRIQIDGRIEGLVVQANWRSIRVQTDSEDTAIIPNSLIAKAEIVNRSSPSERRSASVELTCPNRAVPERVIAALLDATLMCPDIQRSPGPNAVLKEIGIKRSTYKISFFVENTQQLSSTKDLLLRSARRQLDYSGFFNRQPTMTMRENDMSRDSASARRLLMDAVVFECLTDAQLDEVACQMHPLRLEPGEKLFERGATDCALYIVASGILELTRLLASGPETLGNIGAGEYVGEIGLLTGVPHEATAVASTHCTVYRLEREAIATLLKENRQLMMAIDKSARHGLQILHRQVAAGAAPDIGARGHLLLRIRHFFNFGSSPES